MSAAEVWTDATRQRARIVQNALLSVATAARNAGASGAVTRVLLDPYRRKLEELYEREMPLARLIDASDLILHVHGPAASAPSPRVTLVTKLLTSTRDQITRLAKQFGGFSTAMRVPAALDMDFAGVAAGSLYIGFAAGEDGNPTRRAVSTIAAAGHVIANDQPFASLSRYTDDPAARDIALAAVRHLSPSGQIGVKEIDVFGKAVTGGTLSLNVDTRRRARTIMAQRAGSIAADPVSFVGTVREVDLDAYRFEIRNVEGQDDDVRCAHELEESEVKALVDKRVRVHGTPERGPRGTVRLLWVDEVEVLD